MDRIGIIGAGIVGLALARRLVDRAEIYLLDKESQVAVHQSGHNSGVVHSGVYYAPGSLKATLCRRGAVLMRDYCRDHQLPYHELGKIIVARDDRELVRLQELQRRSEANQVPGVRWLTAAEVTELEPQVRSRAGLLSPTAAVVDFRQVARSLAADVRAAGGRVLLDHEVIGIRRQADKVEVLAGGERFLLDQLIICAGLQGDLLAGLAGDGRAPMIIGFRGEYYRLVPERTGLVSRLIYPVPDPAYPFLGVHFTPGIDGSVHVGPNAVPALAREGYRRRDVKLSDLARELSYPGSWRLARQHWRAGVRELYGSIVKRAYLAQARSYLPGLTAADVVRAPAGVRAQALDPDGQLVDDFRISTLGPITAVRNAPSPAATSSLAIAEHIAGLLGR